MSFSVLVPARLHSTRLARKVLADLHGLPMIVRVAQQAQRSQARQVVVAADDAQIVQACQAHGVTCLLTDPHHATGSDRLAQASTLLGLGDNDVVVNVQGDEPLVHPDLINACAELLQTHAHCVMGTVACPIETVDEWRNPHVVKVVCDAQQHALYFSRAPIPYPRSNPDALPEPAPLRHVGLYAYRVGFLRRFSTLSTCALEQAESLEQLRVLWHGLAIAVHTSAHACEPGVDTPDDLIRVRSWLKCAITTGP